MTTAATPGWDLYTPEEYGFDPDELREVVESSGYCFMARLRRDGHPVGAYYGAYHKDGFVYIPTNVYRQAYKAIKRDPRISVVFAKHDVGEVTIIGHGEIIDDRELVESFFRERAPRNARVASGEWTVEQFMRFACSENRKLIKVIPQRVISIDMRKLPWDAE